MKIIRPDDISRLSESLGQVDRNDLLPLPEPYNEEPPAKKLDPKVSAQQEALLDGTIAVGIPKPGSPKEEEELIRRFLSGLEKLLSKESNWAFLQQLVL